MAGLISSLIGLEMDAEVTRRFWTVSLLVQDHIGRSSPFLPLDSVVSRWCGAGSCCSISGPQGNKPRIRSMHGNGREEKERMQPPVSELINFRTTLSQEFFTV